MGGYWIAWGYRHEAGFWASFESRQEAEKQQREWKAKYPLVDTIVYHVKDEGIQAMYQDNQKVG